MQRLLTRGAIEREPFRVVACGSRLGGVLWSRAGHRQGCGVQSGCGREEYVQWQGLRVERTIYWFARLD